MHSLIMWLMVILFSTQPTLTILLRIIDPSFNIIGPYGIVLCRNEKRLSSFLFLRHVEVFLCVISLVCRLIYPYSNFSSYFCFFVIVVLLIFILFVLLLVAVINLSQSFMQSSNPRIVFIVVLFVLILLMLLLAGVIIQFLLILM